MDMRREPSGRRATIPPEATPESERRVGRSMLFKAAMGALILSSLFISISGLMQYNRLEETRAELQEQADEEQEQIEKLRYYLGKDVDDEYVAGYAREYLGLYFPDEKVFHNRIHTGR